jgi:hypothetical protein
VELTAAQEKETAALIYPDAPQILFINAMLAAQMKPVAP